MIPKNHDEEEKKEDRREVEYRLPLQDGADLEDGGLEGGLLAGDLLVGVGLGTAVVVGVLPVLLLALELNISVALGLEAATLLEAAPRLDDGELARLAVKGERGGVALEGNVAVVVGGAVEEVVGLSRGGGALGLVVEDLVLEEEAHAAAGGLLLGGGLCDGGVEVKVIDGPLCDLCTPGHARFALGAGGEGDCGEGHGRGGQNEESGEELHFGGDV